MKKNSSRVSRGLDSENCIVFFPQARWGSLGVSKSATPSHPLLLASFSRLLPRQLVAASHIAELAGLGLGPNREVSEENVRECQNRCQINCQVKCQNICEKECQTECLNTYIYIYILVCIYIYIYILVCIYIYILEPIVHASLRIIKGMCILASAIVNPCVAIDRRLVCDWDKHSLYQNRVRGEINIVWHDDNVKFQPYAVFGSA